MVLLEALTKMLLFYLRSRGIDEKDAKKMMIEGFLAEAVQKITDKNFQQLFLNKLALSNEYKRY